MPEEGLRPPTVVKLGGSLARGGAHYTLLDTIAALALAGHEIVIVPGGGAFADTVRRECDDADTSSTATHWMAVLAMDQMAYRLAGRGRNGDETARTSRGTRGAKLRVVRSAPGVARALERRRVPVLAPFRWLRAEDPLPHGWDVTSDSIAAWVAARLGARRLILLKSVDGIYDDSETLLPVVARTAIRATTERATRIVDRYFGRALAEATECWIINGRRPDRLRALVEHDATTGTVVRAEIRAGAERDQGARGNATVPAAARHGR